MVHELVIYKHYLLIIYAGVKLDQTSYLLSLSDQ